MFLIETYIVGTHLNYHDKRQVYKSMCCGYSFELPRLVKAIQEYPQ